MFSVLLLFTTVQTTLDAREANHQRLHQQEQAEQAFVRSARPPPAPNGPLRSLRVRTPPPLAMFEPGVDEVTGQSLFLEGHRQNSAMFADARAQARTGGFGGLTPAKLYHLFLPLLLIALGYGVVLRERKTRTLVPLLSQGVSGPLLYRGKLVALIGLLSLLALFSSIGASLSGESFLTSMTLYLGNLLYLGILSAIRVLTVLVIPRIGVTSASVALPTEGKILTDMRMNDDLRKHGDGHNAADPAFTKLRANLLAQYNVDTIEELPVNFRGIVSAKNETDQAETLNAYAEKRMQREQALQPTTAFYTRQKPCASVGWRLRCVYP